MCDHWIAAQRVSPLSRLLFLRQKDSAVSCKIQTSLIERWAIATRELSESTAALGDPISQMPLLEHQGLWAAAERASIAAENVRLKLERHRKEHGC
jgi:hypothetical protein